MEDSSLPDTIKQVDNQTCIARTRATMQRLLHGLDTQVLGHVQVASPPSTILPQSTHLFTPPFKDKVKIFVHINVQSHGGQGQWLSWRQRGRPQPRVPQGL